MNPNPENPETEPTQPDTGEDTEEYVYIVAEPGQEGPTAERLIRLAQAKYGPNAHANIQTNTDEGLSFRVPAELAKEWEAQADEDQDDDGEEAGEEGEEFNPTDHPAADVTAYLEDADEDERERVLQAEEAGKGRKSVLNWVPDAR